MSLDDSRWRPAAGIIHHRTAPSLTSYIILIDCNCFRCQTELARFLHDFPSPSLWIVLSYPNNVPSTLCNPHRRQEAWKGTSPPTIVGIRKLECFCYLTVKTSWSYVHSSRQGTSVWRTDGRTVRRNCCSYYSALHCKQCGCTVKNNHQLIVRCAITETKTSLWSKNSESGNTK